MLLSTRGIVWAALVGALLLAPACRKDEKLVKVPGPAVPLAPGAVLQAANLVHYHASITATTADAECRACHGDMSMERAGTAAKPAFHPRHLTILANWKCTDCHAPVDLLERSAGNLRRQVDVATCVGCHKPGGVAAAVGYQLYQN